MASKSGSTSKKLCDVCDHGDGWQGLDLIDCVECGVCVRFVCYGYKETSGEYFEKHDFICHACKSVGKEIVGATKKKGEVTKIKVDKRPTACVLCSVKNGIHAMTPLYDKPTKQGKHLVREGDLCWVHTVCALAIASSRATAGCVYGCDIHGNYEVEDGEIVRDSDDDESNGDDTNEPISMHHFCICGKEDGEWWNALKESRELKCYLCEEAPNKNSTLQVPLQCCAGDVPDGNNPGIDTSIFGKKVLNVKPHCFQAMHVGCAKWRGNPDYKRVYFFPGTFQNTEHISPISERFCDHHAKLVETKTNERITAEKEAKAKKAAAASSSRAVQPIRGGGSPQYSKRMMRAAPARSNNSGSRRNSKSAQSNLNGRMMDQDKRVTAQRRTSETVGNWTTGMHKKKKIQPSADPSSSDDAEPPTEPEPEPTMHNIMYSQPHKRARIAAKDEEIQKLGGKRISRMVPDKEKREQSKKESSIPKKPDSIPKKPQIKLRKKVVPRTSSFSQPEPSPPPVALSRSRSCGDIPRKKPRKNDEQAATPTATTTTRRNSNFKDGKPKALPRRRQICEEKNDEESGASKYNDNHNFIDDMVNDLEGVQDTMKEGETTDWIKGRRHFWKNETGIMQQDFKPLWRNVLSKVGLVYNQPSEEIAPTLPPNIVVQAPDSSDEDEDAEEEEDPNEKKRKKKRSKWSHLWKNKKSTKLFQFDGWDTSRVTLLGEDVDMMQNK